MDIIEAMWLCYDYGIYTHGITMELLTHPDIFSIIPTEGARIEDICHDVYVLLSDKRIK